MYYGSGVISGASAPLEPADSGTFTFSGQTFGTTNANVSDTSAASKWSLVAPTFAPYDGSDNKLVWYSCSVKVEETTVEGETPIEGDAEVDAEGATTTKEGKDKSVKTADEKTKDKSVKPSGDKAEASSSDKGKSLNKEPKKK